MKDEYIEPVTEETAELKIKGSRFIGRIVPVVSQEEAGDALAAIRKEHYDATHNCWAWRVGIEGDHTRFSDDGEPNGTAGQPILRQIEGADLTNALVVVTRYYGGTKLGTGGLARAYGDAAARVVGAVPTAVRTVRERVVVRFDYDDTSPAMHTIGRFDIKIADSVYGERTELHLNARVSDVEAFRAAFVEALSGRGELG